MERYLRKSAGNGLERGFGPAAMIDRPLQQQSATRSGLKTRNPCSTRPIGRMSRLTEKVKTEIPAKRKFRVRGIGDCEEWQIVERDWKLPGNRSATRIDDLISA